jgi:hypothetical protein
VSDGWAMAYRKYSKDYVRLFKALAKPLLNIPAFLLLNPTLALAALERINIKVFILSPRLSPRGILGYFRNYSKLYKYLI